MYIVCTTVSLAIDHKAPVYLFTRVRLHRSYTQSVRGLGLRLSPPTNRRPTFRLWYSARYHRRRLIIITGEGRGGQGLPVNREILPLESFHLESLFSRVHQSPAYCVPSSLSHPSITRSFSRLTNPRKGERTKWGTERYVLGMETCLTVVFGINMLCI